MDVKIVFNGLLIKCGRVYADSSTLKPLKRIGKNDSGDNAMSLAKLDTSMLFTGKYILSNKIRIMS